MCVICATFSRIALHRVSFFIFLQPHFHDTDDDDDDDDIFPLLLCPAFAIFGVVVVVGRWNSKCVLLCVICFCSVWTMLLCCVCGMMKITAPPPPCLKHVMQENCVLCLMLLLLASVSHKRIHTSRTHALILQCANTKTHRTYANIGASSNHPTVQPTIINHLAQWPIFLRALTAVVFVFCVCVAPALKLRAHLRRDTRTRTCVANRTCSREYLALALKLW